MNSSILIDMNKEGVSDAAGRVQGIKVKNKVVQIYNESKPGRIILDFTNVTYITSGLAKELFGGLYQAFGVSMKDIIGIRLGKDNDTLKATILRALSTVISPR